MKKFLIALSFVLLLVIGYLLYTLNQVNNKLLTSETGDYGTIISQLENELSVKTQELSELKAEYQQLKDSISGTTIESGDDTTNTSNDGGSNGNTATTNSKEVGIIKQIYNDANGNRKLEIDYVQLRGYGENGCQYPLCIVNENSKLRTFTVSNNVQIIMKTLDYDNQTISYDYLYQIFNTNNYSEYKYLKDTPFRITIENDVIVKIEEQFVS